MKPDSSGNIIVVAGYSGEGNFGGVKLKSFPGFSVNTGAFIAKLDGTSGNVIWIKFFGDNWSKGAIANLKHIEIDKYNNIYFSGISEGYTYFDNFMLFADKGILIKLNTDGDFVFMKSLTRSSKTKKSSIITGFKIGDDESVTFAGIIPPKDQIEYGAFSYDNKSDEDNIYFFIKFDKDDNVVWFSPVAHGNSKDCEGGNCILYAGDKYGNSAMYFRYEKGGLLVRCNAKGENIKTLKYDFGREKDYRANEITFDDDSNVYVAGYGKQIFNWDLIGDQQAVRVDKFNYNLNRVWLTHGTGGINEANSIFFNNATSNIITTVNFNSTFIFYSESSERPIKGSKWAIANSDYNILAASISKEPALSWQKSGSALNKNYISSHAIEDKCGNKIISFCYTNQELSFDGLNINEHNKACSTAILKYASDTGNFYAIGNSACGIIHLKSDFDSSYKKLYWFCDGKAIDSFKNELIYSFPLTGSYPITLLGIKENGCQKAFTDTVEIIVRVNSIDKPQMLRATFETNSQVEVSWKQHPQAEFYTLYKQHANGEIQTIVKHFSDTAYMDNSVSVSEQFQYFITATDSCGKVSEQSLLAQPVILQGENVENKYILLHRTAYEKWENGVAEYVLEMQDADGSYISVANSPETKYTDSLRNINHLLQQCYRIKAIEKDGNKQISYSNEICVDHLPQLFIPDAFSPNNDNLNEQFKIYTIGIKEYTINIYNRWGELVFSGNEKNALWNGKVKSLTCPEGKYIYTLQAQSLSGENINRTGNITILK